MLVPKRPGIPVSGPVDGAVAREPRALDGYFAALDERVRELVAAGVGLADVAQRAELPQFSGWDRYQQLHAANANRAYLAAERAGFADDGPINRP
jgi:hypothetical protein